LEHGQGGETSFDTQAAVQLTPTEIYQENGEGDLEARGSAKGADVVGPQNVRVRLGAMKMSRDGCGWAGRKIKSGDS
jgi:hypothetical protein